MVNLGDSVWRIQGDIVQTAVVFLVQLPVGEQAHQEFANNGPWPKET